MAKAKPPLNPFAAAQVKPTAVSKPKAEVVLAEAVIDASGAELYSQATVIEAMNNFAVGKAKADEGEALMETTRPIVTALGLQVYAEQFVELERKPENPKITTDANGTGVLIGVSFVDRQINLNEAEYANLCNLVGAGEAEKMVENRNTFILKPDTLDLEVEVKVNGKAIKDTVMNHMARVLGETFAENPAIIANLFELKPVFRTQKGVIHNALKLVGTPRDGSTPHRVQSFLKAVKSPITLKPTGSPTPIAAKPAK